ncbi:MAG: hypothetical protein FJ267_11780, partial [Planctomycetes bacterium]|nr:hypothetical protein [Planctomycetota bacterium]
MSLLPDSADLDNIHNTIGTSDPKPTLLTNDTWKHICERYQLRGDLGDGGQAVVLRVKEKVTPH